MVHCQVHTRVYCTGPSHPSPPPPPAHTPNENWPLFTTLILSFFCVGFCVLWSFLLEEGNDNDGWDNLLFFIFGNSWLSTPGNRGGDMWSLKSVSDHLQVVILNGRNTWEVVVRSDEVVQSDEVATGLEVAALKIRGKSIELITRYPGGTWVWVWGFPLDANELRYSSFLKTSET